jgi:poly-gamma-glutamate synthesis protein (capsule biosynthesis protein)
LPDLTEATARRIVDRTSRLRGRRDLVVASIHWGGNWGYEVPPEHVRFAHCLIDGGVDIVHGHSSHHPRPLEVYRNRLILYGCGDFIDDYEGIEGDEEYRDDLVLMYFAMFSPSGRELTAVEATLLQIRKMTLNRPSDADTAWMRDTLERVSAPFGTHVERTGDGTLSLRWGDVNRPALAVTG